MSAWPRYVLSALVVTWLTACSRHLDGTPGAAKRDTLHLIATEDPHKLNPILATSGTETALARLAFDSLLIADAKNDAVPMLAMEVPTVANGGIARDGLTYTVHLRRGVSWQDGAPFTSADVAFTMKAILDPRSDVGDRSGYDTILRVETPNATTAIFRLKRRFAPFIAQVCEQSAILPKHLLGTSHNLNADKFNEVPIGTGPYRLIRWSRGTKLTYVANRSYFLGAPKIGRIDVAIMPDIESQDLAIRRHDADFNTVESSQYQRLRLAGDLRTTTEPMNDVVAIALNTEHAALADVRVRRAIAMGIDRQRIARNNTFGTGTVAYADLPNFIWTSSPVVSPTPYDPSAARKLLEAAGWHVGASGIRVKGGLPLNLAALDAAGSATGRSVDAQTQQMLRAIGISVSFKYVPPALYEAPVSSGGQLALGRFDLADYGFNGGVDPLNDALYTCANRAPAGPNVARYCDARMDALQTASLTELDPRKRLSIVAGIEKLAANDVPYVFLYHTPKRLVWVPSLQRTHSNLIDPWYDVRHWTIRDGPTAST